MKTIGIKLADGTFYPILEEGNVKTYQLDLTTVKDGQTKVQIDLYRSEKKSMEDAEYVDTLEVSNLIPHPNGEAELHLSVGINENNELDAKVVDSETGKQSQTSVTLVNRTLQEREEPANFELTQGTTISEAAIPEIDEQPQEPEISVDVEDFLDEGNDVSPALTEDLKEFESKEQEFQEETSNSEEKIDSLDDFSFAEFTDDDKNENQNEQKTSSEDVFVSEPFSFDSEIQKEESQQIPEEEIIPVEIEKEEVEPKIEFESETENEFAEKTEIEEEISKQTENIADLATEDVNDDFNENHDELNIEEKTPEDENFNIESLPELDDSLFKDDNESKTEATGLQGIFDDPDFENDPVFNDTNLDSNNEEKFDTSSLDFPSTNENFGNEENPPMDFSDLYDDKDLNGENEEEETKRKTRAPVIICIVCAIICIIATLLVLFIIPSKYNLLGKTKESETSITEIEKTNELPEKSLSTEVAPIPEETTSVPNEAEAESEVQIEVAPAEENEIVVAETPENVVPVVEEKPEEKEKDVTYRIRWGDTLWDISDAYYKNPWRYKKIANYNKIKNPDLIISGTDILIPVE